MTIKWSHKVTNEGVVERGLLLPLEMSLIVFVEVVAVVCICYTCMMKF